MLSKTLKFILYFVGFLLLFGFYYPVIKANNIYVSNVQVIHKNTIEHWAAIQFDLSYDNAWRINSGAANWSAAWIFIKYRLADGIWKHATISPLINHHVMPANVECSVPSDGKGIFIYDSRLSIENYNFTATGIIIRWNYGTDGLNDNELSVDIKMNCIEMVFIPESSFYLGSGGTEINAFYQYPNLTTPYQVDSENEINVGNSNGFLYYDNQAIRGGDRQGPVPNSFPKGYRGFYTMRYEISQQQYVDFLNSLTRAQQNSRTASDVSGSDVPNRYVMSNTASMVDRNSIACPATGNSTLTPIDFYCDYNQNGIGESNDGQNVACGYLSWEDGLAYFDWSGLRPMTELEFEKACRGNAIPFANEYPWGNTIFTQVDGSILNAGLQNELVGNSGPGLSNIDESQVGIGPLRCGFASTAITTKVESGASFYGLSNLGDNLSERCVTIGSPAGRSFTGLHGDGILNSTGNPDVINWPGPAGISLRGSSFMRQAYRMGVSERSFGLYILGSGRTNRFGMRGVRSVE